MRLLTSLSVANTALLLLVFAAIATYSSIYQFAFADFAHFLAYTVVFIIIPGGLATSALSLSGFSLKSKFILANALGLSGLCYFSWLLNAKFKLPYYSGVYLVVALSLFFLLKNIAGRQAGLWQLSCLPRRILNLSRSIELAVLLSIALLAILVSNGFTKNAIIQDGDFRFYGTAGVEGIWHMGNVAYMKKDFDFGDIHQNGFRFAYHFFIYIFVALASNLFSIDTATTFFKLLPIYSFFFLLYSCYVCGSTVFRSRQAGVLAALLALFMDDAAFAVKLGQMLNSTWLEYFYLGPKVTSAYLSSPSYSPALIVFFPLLLLFRNQGFPLKSGRVDTSMVIIAGFLIGTISGFKVSTFLVLGLALMILAAIEFFRQRTVFCMATGVFALAVSFPFLNDLQKSSFASLSFNPAFFPLSSMLRQDLLSLLEASPYHPLVVVSILIIYLPIELGPRLLSLKYLRSDWQRQTESLRLVWLCGIVGVILTLLITPSIDAYNAMYFHRFGAVCLAFLMGRTLLDAFGHKKLKLVLISSLCFFYVAGGLYTFFRLRSEPALKVPQDKIVGLQKLVSPQDNGFKVVMSNRFSYAESESNENIFYLYSAFSENKVLSEGERFSIIRFADSLGLKRVRDDIARFYATNDHHVARTILEKWSVDYVIVDLEYDQKLHFDASFLEQVHASKSLIIYAFRREAERS